MHNLLINNWRYFFKGNVLTTLNGETETTANEQSFIQLMEVNIVNSEVFAKPIVLKTAWGLNLKGFGRKAHTFRTNSRIIITSIFFQSMAWSFSQSDIEQFRTNLTSCNELQFKCGLYTKSIFRQQMSQALLALLLSVLLVRSHELCRDDIISTLFYILTNDTTTNFAYFIHRYLEQSNIQTILNDKHKRLLLENYGRNETVGKLLLNRK